MSATSSSKVIATLLLLWSLETVLAQTGPLNNQATNQLQGLTDGLRRLMEQNQPQGYGNNLFNNPNQSPGQLDPLGFMRQMSDNMNNMNQFGMGPPPFGPRGPRGPRGGPGGRGPRGPPPPFMGPPPMHMLTNQLLMQLLQQLNNLNNNNSLPNNLFPNNNNTLPFNNNNGNGNGNLPSELNNQLNNQLDSNGAQQDLAAANRRKN